MAFSPIQASKDITSEYYRYLSTIFSINDADFERQFLAGLSGSDTPFAKGPYLEVTDAFETGETITELIESKELPKSFTRLGFHLSRPLYRHQIDAFRLISAGKSIVVSTGTGSGKTESFLLPILKELVTEDERGELTDGVRAMLIYPMNALANDQVERLRSLLKDYPRITYGCYTGQTAEKFKDALVSYRDLNGHDPANNELISREQMKAHPPHLLITNYAMLEYLMVRPDDSVFFSPNYTEHWQFIVLDEAHVYKGSTGIEVAMLLRRLSARLQRENIQYILTSATLGGDQDNDAVSAFAANLCNRPFTPDCVIRAKRRRLIQPEKILSISPEFYEQAGSMIEADQDSEEIAQYIRGEYGIREGTLEESLYKLIYQDAFYWQLREALREPRTIAALTNRLNCSAQRITDFVTVATRAVFDGAKLFDARYHMFLRAAESVYVTFAPRKQLFLESRRSYFENGSSYKVFELATCSHCHAMYIIGRESPSGILEQAAYHPDADPRSVYLVDNEYKDTDDEHTLEAAGQDVESFELCAVCGQLRRPGTKLSCEHGTGNQIKVQRVKLKEGTERLTKCPHCENVSSTGILRQFFVGQEAVTSVIGTSLFESLPSYTVEHTTAVEEDFAGFDVGFDNDATTEAIRHDVGAKQFIAFSDSRQAAAFYATYLDQTYQNIVYKRLVHETLKKREYGTIGKNLNEFVEDLMAQFEKYHMTDADSLRKAAWKAALHEAVDNNGNTSMYKLGLIRFDISDEYIVPNSRYQLSKEDVHEVCALFVDWMMSEGAIRYPEPLNYDERCFFVPSGIEHDYTLSDSNAKSYTLSFLPSKDGFSNKRLVFLARLLRSKGIEVSEDELVKLLQGFWNAFFIKKETGLLAANEGKYRVRSDRIIVRRPEQIYICDKCKRISTHYVNGVCTSYRCDGRLKPINPEKEFSNNHYYHLYQELEIRPLRVVEHTAQLSKEAAYSYQNHFKKKEIDILSCSTTFEMGVDVGSLETVFMRNVPPSPANYAQRAGRAGRSIYSAAYALTFCNKSNHDFAFFKEPERMIRGRIDPPVFDVENQKIAVRHLYASAFSFFWKKYESYFSNVERFLSQNTDGEDGLSTFRAYLESKPDDLKEFLVAFLPKRLIAEFGVEDFLWTDRLVDPDGGLLSLAVESYKKEIAELKEAADNAFHDMSWGVDSLHQRIKVYQREGILAYLARKNIFPKYGFPVDTVEMTIIDKRGALKTGLQLQRDLAMAISEYAPDSQIIANGKLITSRYIRKMADRSWKMNRYCICEVCGDLNTSFYDAQTSFVPGTCANCGAKLKGTNSGVYLIPEFGFEADGDKVRKPGLIKPTRTYRSDVSYSGIDKPDEETRIPLGNAIICIRSGKEEEMAVINRSNFFVCEKCGFTVLDEKYFANSKKKKHKRSSGSTCPSETLRKFSLAYRFRTDILTAKFLGVEITEEDEALSILYGLLEGISKALCIDREDIDGCLKWFFNRESGVPNYGFVFYDKTPGGAGHVRRLKDQATWMQVLNESLNLMLSCNCGGEEMDTSCYSCLRNYYNQKYHERLQRRFVVHFLDEVLGENPRTH